MIDVLIDMTALNTGSRDRGIGRYVHELCRALSSRSSWAASPARGADLELVGLTQHYGAVEGALDPTLSFTGDAAVSRSARRYQRHKLERRLFLGGLAHRTGARLLHLPDPPGTPVDRRIPRIVTCHDLIPLVLAKDYLSPLPGARALQKARDRARYATAERVIAISEATKRDLVDQLGVPEDRIDVVHHGVDHGRFRAQAAPTERAELLAATGISRPYLLYLGAGDKRKSLPLLVQAFARSGVAKDVRLVLAGPLSRREREKLVAVAESEQVTGDVTLLGYVDDAQVAALYRQCLAHVFPSAYEGFGLPVLEAMACGAPTLTTSLSALGEVAGEAALLLDTLELETLAAGLRRIVDDDGLRATLKERGLRQASRFTWRRCAEETLECYRRALGQGSR